MSASNLLIAIVILIILGGELLKGGIALASSISTMKHGIARINELASLLLRSDVSWCVLALHPKPTACP